MPFREFRDQGQAREMAARIKAARRRVDIAVAFGKAVKIRRVEVGISQEALADKAGFARSFLSGIELGTKMPTTMSVWRLAQALDCAPSDLWLTAERLFHEGAGKP